MKDYHLKPGFVSGSAGRLYALDVEPAGETVAQAIYLPPHGEELNRCRTMIAGQARELAKRGIACRLLDYYGTGDSDGDFRQGNWSLWLADAAAQIADFQRTTSRPVVVVGCRLGAMLAMDLLADNSLNVQQVVLVQPVLQGKQYVTQLLRQRMALQMSTGADVENTDQLRERIAQGETLEIGGYEFAAELLTHLDGVSPERWSGLRDASIVWIEHVSDAAREIAIVSRKIVAQLQEQGNAVAPVRVCTAPVWQLHERECVQGAVTAFANLELSV